MIARNRVWLLLAAAVAAVASGCAGEPTAAVTGTVTDSAGQPVSGLILFTPQDGAKYREAVEVRIDEGRYDMPKVSVGPKFVSVVITRDGGRSIDATPAPSSVDLIPGPQVLDFTLSKRKKAAPTDE